MRHPLTLLLLAMIVTLVVVGRGDAEAPALNPFVAAPTPTAAGGAVRPSTGLPDVASMVERLGPTVVQVLATADRPGLFGQPTEGQSQGSGVFFDGRGFIITNNHVIENASRVEVALSNRQVVEVEIVGADPETDLAVLKADPAEIDNLVVARLGDTDAMRIGDWVIAIGSPLGFAGSVTVGVVSSKGRSLVVDPNTPPLHDLVQTDAVINPGNSGGPLLNLAGEVVGINTAIIRGTVGNDQEAEGIGFAISMGTAIPVTEQLIANGRVIRPRIGVRILDVTPVVAADRGLSVADGVLIVELTEDGPAARAGVEVGDVIVAVDGTPVVSTSELVRLFLTGYEVGDKINLVVVRGTERLDFEIALEEVS